MPHKDPEIRRAYHRNWVRKRKAEWFLGKTCVRCGSVRNLELDHIERLTKVSTSVFSWSAAARDAELAKCQVLCRDCHRQKSYESGDLLPPSPCGSSNKYRKGCRCDLCKAQIATMASRVRSKFRLLQRYGMLVSVTITAFPSEPVECTSQKVQLALSTVLNVPVTCKIKYTRRSRTSKV